MKTTGCVLLTIGFLWLGGSFPFSLRTPFVVAAELSRSLEEQKTFTDEEVRDIIWEGVEMHQKLTPWLAVPGSSCLMLIGGLLLQPRRRC